MYKLSKEILRAIFRLDNLETATDLSRLGVKKGGKLHNGRYLGYGDFLGYIYGSFLCTAYHSSLSSPGIIACLVLDAVDREIFQLFTGLPLDSYQGYDKALDIYYLAIMYLSTLRNWSNLHAFKLNRFLFYYRLVGVTLFEITNLRPLLLIFPNISEYLFIFFMRQSA